MKKITLLVLALSILTLLPLFAGGEKEKGMDKMSKEYVFATDSTWPPMEFIDTDNNEIVGFTIDLVNAIAKEEGISVKFVSTQWDGIFAGLAVGDYDAISSSVTITEERKEKFDFSDSYFNAGQVLAVRKDESAGINGLADLVGKEVGAQIGTSGAEEIKKYDGVILQTYDSLGPAAEELANGTIAGIVADNPLIADYLLKNKKYEGLFVSIGEPMTSEEYGIVFTKDKTELRKIINSGLAKVKANGVYDKIYAKWIK